VADGICNIVDDSIEWFCVITHADGSCGVQFLPPFVCVFSQKTDASRILICECSTMNPGNSFILGSKVESTSHEENVATVGLCTLVGAGFF